MTRDPVTTIHPRSMHKALGAFLDDVNLLNSAAKHALSFLEDDSLDAAAVIKAVAPILRKTTEEMAKWYDV